METVLVTWTCQDDPAILNADHFIVAVGFDEVVAPLSARSQRFLNVESGEQAVYIACVDAAENELAPPLITSVVVP